MYQPWPIVKEVIADARWYCFWLKLRFQGTRKGQFTARTIEILEKEITFLRNLIRNTPWWVRGFLFLGERELALIQRRERKAQPREIHSLEMSASGALTLLEKRNKNDRPLYDRAEFLRGMSYFLKGDFIQALSTFDRLLERGERPGVSPKFIAQVQEYAGSACLALSRPTEARSYLKRIPSHYRSAEVLEVMNYLDKL